MWREKRVLLAILGVLLAANTLFFFTYRLQYEERLKDLDDRREQAEARLNTQHAARLQAERRLVAYRNISRDVQDIYTRQWSTENERLTALIAEVKRLAVASELVPKSISYTREQPKNTRTRTAAETVTISFSVQGNYQQVRRLINLFELSRQFIIINQISLTSSQEQLLTLNLQLQTLFRDTMPVANERAARSAQLTGGGEVVRTASSALSVRRALPAVRSVM